MNCDYCGQPAGCETPCHACASSNAGDHNGSIVWQVKTSHRDYGIAPLVGDVEIARLEDALVAEANLVASRGCRTLIGSCGDESCRVHGSARACEHPEVHRALGNVVRCEACRLTLPGEVVDLARQSSEALSTTLRDDFVRALTAIPAELL